MKKSKSNTFSIITFVLGETLKDMHVCMDIDINAERKVWKDGHLNSGAGSRSEQVAGGLFPLMASTLFLYCMNFSLCKGITFFLYNFFK